MDTKSKGDKSVGAVMSALIKAGKIVLLPFGDNQRYDLVINEGNTFQRIQCKTGRLQNGVVEFNACSSPPHGTKRSRHYRGEVEFFGVYCAEIDKVYLVPVEDVGKHNGFLRVDPPKNGQLKNVKFATQYELQAVIA